MSRFDCGGISYHAGWYMPRIGTDLI